MQQAIMCSKCGTTNHTRLSRCQFCGESLHDEEVPRGRQSGMREMQRTHTSPRDKARRLRRAGLIVGLLGAGVSIAVSFFSCTLSSLGGWSYGLTNVVFLWPVHWGVLAVARRSSLEGGSMLILDSVVWYLLTFTVNPVPIVSAVLLVSGILFVLSWREKRRYGPDAVEEIP